MGKFGKVVERGDNRKWLKTDPKPNLLTITTGPPPYTNKNLSALKVVVAGWLLKFATVFCVVISGGFFGLTADQNCELPDASDRYHSHDTPVSIWTTVSASRARRVVSVIVF